MQQRQQFITPPVPRPRRWRSRARRNSRRDRASRRGDARDAGVRDPERHRRRGGAHRQGQARHPAAGRERQHRADDGQRRPARWRRRITSGASTSSTKRTRKPNIGNFHLGPHAGRAQVSTRIRLADSQKIVAIARLSDGSFWSASVDVVVTLAACTEEVI